MLRAIIALVVGVVTGAMFFAQRIWTTMTDLPDQDTTMTLRFEPEHNGNAEFRWSPDIRTLYAEAGWRAEGEYVRKRDAAISRAYRR